MNIDQLFERLKSHYPDCEITRSENTLTIRLPFAEVHLNEHHADFFLNKKPLTSLNAEGDDLYEAVESFILSVQQSQSENNPTLIAAMKHVQKDCQRINLIIEFAILGSALLAASAKKPLLFVVLFPICFLLFFVNRYRRLRIFESDWVCPRCGHQLPINKKSFFPQISSVSSCPNCGEFLLDKDSFAQSLREELDLYENTEEDEEIPEPVILPPSAAAKALRIIIGILCLVSIPFCGLITAALFDELPPSILSLNISVMLLTGAAGLVLLLCRSSVKDTVVRERNAISWLGAVISVFGLFVVFLSFLMGPDGLASAVSYSICALLFLFLGVFVLLAGQNRAVCLRPSSLVYVNIFGKTCEFDSYEIRSVLMTASQSIRFVDSMDRKLFSVEGNMSGISFLLDWIVSHNIPVKTTDSLNRTLAKEQNEPLFWHEEDRTAMHSHLKAIRIGMFLTVFLFGAGVIGSTLLYISRDIKMKTAIYLCCFSSIPLILYTLVFVPVFLFDSPKHGATDEWSSMHIKFPTVTVLIFSLLCFWESHYFWAKYVLQIVETGRFFLLTLAIAIPIFYILFTRMPKRLRNAEFITLSVLSLLILSSSIAYGGLVAFAKPVRHYPAIVTEHHKSSSDSDDSSTLTVLLDDGKPFKMHVTDSLYRLEASGTEFVICQKETAPGIRLVRLHLPESK